MELKVINRTNLECQDIFLNVFRNHLKLQDPKKGLRKLEKIQRNRNIGRKSCDDNEKHITRGPPVSNFASSNSVRDGLTFLSCDPKE